MPFVSIDIETLGLDPDTCDVIEFGAVIHHMEKTLEELPRYHCYLTKRVYSGEPFAMAMHSKILARIAAREDGWVYLNHDFLGEDFADWLAEQGYNRQDPDDPIKIVAAGKNFAGFDQRFLRRIDNFDRWIKIHHRVMDPCMMYFDPKKDETPPSLEVCLQRAGINKSVQHTAVEDAIDVIRCLRYKWGM
jgi:oligoribonuclease (3'-5' exoribonuclease)